MPPPNVELANPHLRRGPVRVAVFDFDGTCSLVREGWSGIMASMGVELLADPAGFDFLELEMLRLSGMPSAVQMGKLAEIAAERGRPSPPALDLLADFNRRLAATTDGRRARLADGTDPPEAWTVPGTHELLRQLEARGVLLVLASGTPIDAVRAEVGLLRLSHFFGERVYAPEGSSTAFSKRAVIERLLSDTGAGGEGLIGFGDGYAETVEVKRAGGVAVGVASVEAGKGGVNAVKRRMLLELGADVIVPHYEPAAELAAWLWGEVE